MIDDSGYRDDKKSWFINESTKTLVIRQIDIDAKVDKPVKITFF